MLTPENTLFVRGVRGVQGAAPVLLLADAPFHDALPKPAAEGTALPRCEGWTVVPRLTLCVVDGPGELGVIIPSFVALVLWESPDGASAEPASMDEWCADAEQAGGAVVLSLPRLPATFSWARLLTADDARGGFMAYLS